MQSDSFDPRRRPAYRQLAPLESAKPNNDKQNDLARGWRCTHLLQAHTSWVRSVAVSPNGRWIASGSGDKTVRIWSLSSGKLRQVLVGHEGW
ncbi:MAG: hypothetical protein HC839_06355, partial [Leptolyngbyaceae cyanobacterium RM2_2_21]|nr:hypothetical protein [Leptolyngbyaceae cyanobacterium RM2_2_21]